MALRITTLCVKDGFYVSKLSEDLKRDYIRRLHSMLERNLTVPFAFNPITDFENEFDSQQQMPLNQSCLRHAKNRIWWQKMTFYNPERWGHDDIILAMDLDIVIMRNVDEMVKGPLPTCPVPTHGDPGKILPSWVLFHVEHGREIWDTYMAHDFSRPPPTAKAYNGDGEFIINFTKWPWERPWPTEWTCHPKFERCTGRAKVAIYTGRGKMHERPNDPIVREHWK